MRVFIQIVALHTNHRRLDMLEKRASDAITAKAPREANRIVGICGSIRNRDSDRTGLPLATLLLPACRQPGEVDLRRLERHRGATIENLIPALSCWTLWS
jgi:hypothetical protein